MKGWIVLLLFLGCFVGLVLFSASMRVRAYRSFGVPAERLQDAVRHEAGLRDVRIETDSTAPYGLVISCRHQLPPMDKARLEQLFREYLPNVPTQEVDRLLDIS